MTNGLDFAQDEGLETESTNCRFGVLVLIPFLPVHS
jgi:hypothetical protein